MKIRRSKLLAQGALDFERRRAETAGGHCGGKTCLASRGARRGGKHGVEYPCLCACEPCTKIRRAARGESVGRGDVTE